MNDLISRQAAQAIPPLPKCYREYATSNLDDAYDKGFEDALFSLNALPTIEPKKGKWITKKDACGIGYQICSNCGTEIQWRDRHGVILRVDMQNVPYCPNCGAKMERSEDVSTDM